MGRIFSPLKSLFLSFAGIVSCHTPYQPYLESCITSIQKAYLIVTLRLDELLHM